MEKPDLKYQLYDLTPQVFEELCHDVLKEEFNYDKTFLFAEPNDNGVDILALKGIEKFAIQVKHRYKLTKGALKQEIEKNLHHLEFHNKLILITSAQIDKKEIFEFETDNISIISRNELIILLDKHLNITQRYFKIAEIKKKSIENRLTSSLIGIGVSLFFSLSIFIFDKKENDKPLSSSIDNVEQALLNIKGLEKDLQGIKEDMIKTDLENKKILEEYEKMQGLEAVILERKESLKSVLDYEPWYKKVLNYILGLITGVFSSIIASILWNRCKLKKELNK